ncbi:MAG: response regulator transcription factor [bacterium]
MAKLTKRELEILALIGYGLTNKQISTTLNIAVSTVETHRKNMRKKLKLKGNSTLIRYALLNENRFD